MSESSCRPEGASFLSLTHPTWYVPRLQVQSRMVTCYFLLELYVSLWIAWISKILFKPNHFFFQFFWLFSNLQWNIRKVSGKGNEMLMWLLRYKKKKEKKRYCIHIASISPDPCYCSLHRSVSCVCPVVPLFVMLYLWPFPNALICLPGSPVFRYSVSCSLSSLRSCIYCPFPGAALFSFTSLAYISERGYFCFPTFLPHFRL